MNTTYELKNFNFAESSEQAPIATDKIVFFASLSGKNDSEKIAACKQALLRQEIQLDDLMEHDSILFAAFMEKIEQELAANKNRALILEAINSPENQYPAANELRLLFEQDSAVKNSLTPEHSALSIEIPINQAIAAAMLELDSQALLDGLTRILDYRGDNSQLTLDHINSLREDLGNITAKANDTTYFLQINGESVRFTNLESSKTGDRQVA